LELEQDGCTVPDTPLDLGNVHRRSGLARVKEYPRYHQSDHQDSESCKLRPFGSSAEQNDPRNDQKENCDPYRRILIENRHIFSMKNQPDFQVIIGTL
jgi:hypothetical protein